MQSYEEETAKNVDKQKIDTDYLHKSSSPFSNKIPEYVVAFSLKETYDDLVTAQQMICNKRSPQESTNSITPTNSNKTLDINDEQDKWKRISDIPKPEGTYMNLNEKSSRNSNNSIYSSTPTNSIKYLGNEDGSDASLVTVENIVIDLAENDIDNENIDNSIEPCYSENNINDPHLCHLDQTEKISFDSPENMQHKDLENKADTGKEDIVKNPKTKEVLEPINKADTGKEEIIKDPETKEPVLEDIVTINEKHFIIKAIKSNRKAKKLPKQKVKQTKYNKHKQFKYKNPRKIIDNRLENYYNKRNAVKADQIQKELYSSDVSTVVSRTRVLHKIEAKENLMAENELISFINDFEIHEYDNNSKTSTLSTAKKSHSCTSSQNTLTTKDSEKSLNNENDTAVVNKMSVLSISTENVPYKSDIINVAIAVSYDRSKPKVQTVHIPSNQKLMDLGVLTSTEIDKPFNSDITYNLSSDIEDFKAVTIEASDNTLVDKNSSFGMSSNDFVIARTSSDFTKSSEQSTFTLKNNFDTVINIENNKVTQQNENNISILDTVINLNMYPEMTPSTSSDTTYGYDYNDFTVTRNINKKRVTNPNKGDNREQILPKNLLKKITNQYSNKAVNKIINMPNQADIEAMLKEDKPQMKCAEEFRYPHMPDLWEKMAKTLDLAMKRLEDSLAEKIIKDLKQAFLRQQIINEDDTLKNDGEIDVKYTDEGLQCDLVHNTVIDQIVKKLSMDGPKLKDPIAVKSLQKDFYDELEVLKPPDVTADVKQDAITVSTVTYDECKCSRLELLFSGPVKFIRENMFVIASVPAFFIVLLGVYGMILLVMKTW